MTAYNSVNISSGLVPIMRPAVTWTNVVYLPIQGLVTTFSEILSTSEHVRLRHLWVRDSLLCVFICSKISIHSNGWLGHLTGSVNCDVTGQLWRHQKAVSCLGWDESISDTRALVSHARVYETIKSNPILVYMLPPIWPHITKHGNIVFNPNICFCAYWYLSPLSLTQDVYHS